MLRGVTIVLTVARSNGAELAVIGGVRTA